MKPEHTRTARTAKRLLEAIGYLELGMIRHARGCLVDVGDPAALAPATRMIRDEAMRRESRLSEDALPVDLIHPAAPEPVGEDLLLALSRCFWDAGESERAEEVFTYTRPTVERCRQRHGKRGSGHA
jgi:hypothetical protein